MAQYDFAPAWLKFPTPPKSTKSSLNFQKYSENLHWAENHDINYRRHNFSDSGIGCSNGGNFGRKKKNRWRSHGRNGTENISHRGGHHRGSSCSHSSAFHSGKSQGLHENNVPDNETGKKDKEEHKQFEAEDFPSLNPEYERKASQNKSLAAGVWEYPLNTKCRAPRMLDIKKGSTKDLQISGFPALRNLNSQTVKNGTGPSVYKGLVPKPAVPPTKPTEWKSQTKGNNVGTPYPHESTHGIRNFNAFKSTAKNFSVSTNSVKEYNCSNSSPPVDKLNQPHLTKLTQMCTDKKRDFVKALKRDRVEEEHKDGSLMGPEKDDDSFNLYNSNNTHHERDINRNFDENEILQENGRTSMISQQIIRSSTFPQTDSLSSSLEAELRLLKEMGWQEDIENDETCAPLTEDEIREFQVISEQLQKNGLRKNGILKNGLMFDFKFGPWKNSTFKSTFENDTETSSSDTSDDDV
ncbi:vasculin-like [Gracilinanus agilis]|uniref:vasculin-like n=1 Tax=Gracilinanus agilis TaxID=191870 RepID=UPI001CFD1CD8|nr:vasculin-like [Gracilinanus agilis]